MSTGAAAPAERVDVVAVVLAAGGSTRFGRQKLLEPLRDTPLIRRVVDTVLGAGLRSVVAVLGREADAVRDALAGLDVRFVVNHEWERGMSGSIRAGIGALPPDAGAALIVLGDQPDIPGEVLTRLADAWRRERPAIVAPSYQGRHGNPVLFSAAIFPELLELRGDRGARPVVERAPGRVLRVPFSFPPPPDVDTPADMGKLSSGK